LPTYPNAKYQKILHMCLSSSDEWLILTILEKYVQVLFDNILVYTENTPQAHWYNNKLLEYNIFYLIKSKCNLENDEIDFLGHIVVVDEVKVYQ